MLPSRSGLFLYTAIEIPMKAEIIRPEISPKTITFLLILILVLDFRCECRCAYRVKTPMYCYWLFVHLMPCIHSFESMAPGLLTILKLPFSARAMHMFIRTWC